MCGDFNGTSRGAVARFLSSQGFVSAYDASLGASAAVDAPIEPEAQTPPKAATARLAKKNDAGKNKNEGGWISHLNHHGECVGVDHVWVLNPSRQRAGADTDAPPPSWKTAIYAMIQAKMLERGLGSNARAFAFFDVDDDRGITKEEFSVAVSMLELTGEGTPGLVESEISVLYEDCDKDGDGRVDFGEFIKRLDVETMDAAYRAIRASQDIEEGPWDVVGDLMATAASLPSSRASPWTRTSSRRWRSETSRSTTVPIVAARTDPPRRRRDFRGAKERRAKRRPRRCRRDAPRAHDAGRVARARGVRSFRPRTAHRGARAPRVVAPRDEARRDSRSFFILWSRITTRVASSRASQSKVSFVPFRLLMNSPHDTRAFTTWPSWRRSCSPRARGPPAR